MDSSLSSNVNNTYENEIDNIINNYKTQLEVIKTKSSINNNSIPSQNQIATISQIQTSSLPLSNDLSIEIQNDNLKLQTQLTQYKSQLIANKKEIKKLTDKVTVLEKEKIDKEKEYNESIQAIKDKNFSQIESIRQANLNETAKNNLQSQIMKDDMQHNADIINKFYNFFNNNIELFNKAQILSTGEAGKVQYELDNKEKNSSSTDYVIRTMDMFIKKLMTDNTEMFNQLVKYKEMAESQQQYQQNIFQEQNIRDIKYENMLLKQQINSLVEQLNGSEGKSVLGDFPDKKGLMNKTSKKKFCKKRSGSSTGNNINNNNYPSVNVSANQTGFTNKQKLEFEPIKRLKLKIQNLEDKIKGVEMNDNNEE